MSMTKNFKKNKFVKQSKTTKRRDLDAKVAEYRKFLKDDFDWDYEYILRLLIYKLSRTRRCIVENEIVASNERIGRQIQAVEKLLQKVVNDQYSEEISRDFHKKYGKLKMKSGKASAGSRSVPVTFYYQRENDKNRRQIHRERRSLDRQAVRMKERDLARAFALIQKNIWRWWD
jgi:hypothetical protein